MSSSDGVTIPNIWKIENVPNHQPARIYSCYKLKLVLFAVPGWILEGAQSSGIELQVQKQNVSWWLLVETQLFQAELSFNCGLGSVQ
jgi:hypothetical protein